MLPNVNPKMTLSHLQNSNVGYRLYRDEGVNIPDQAETMKLLNG